MKLTNKTDWSDHYIRRLIAWTARQVGRVTFTDFSYKCIKSIIVRQQNRRRVRGQIRYSRVPQTGEGCNWNLDMTVPYRDREAGRYPAFPDPERQLVCDVALSIILLLRKFGKIASVGQEHKVSKSFDDHRPTIFHAWTAPVKPRTERIKPSLTDVRRKKAEENLAAWQRRLKLAQTKVKKWRRKASYYAKKAGVTA